MYAAWSHLPGRKGLASGVVVSGMGVGSFIFGIICNKMVNPNNEKATRDINTSENYFTIDVNARVPFMFEMLCLIWTCQLIFAGLTVSAYKS